MIDLSPVVITGVGVLLVGFALRDMFHTLFHPSGSGTLSALLPDALWRLAKRTGRPLELIGPTSIVVVICAWALLVVVGCALIYAPGLPERFVYAEGIAPTRRQGFFTALYLSLVTLATLGYGDVAPMALGYRLVAPLQALVGFALLTAGLSWILSLYPVVQRRRSLAHQLHLLADLPLRELAASDPDTAKSLVGEVAGQLTIVRQDLIQFPVSYYFHPTAPKSELAAGLIAVLDQLSELPEPDPDPGLRAQLGRFRAALADLVASARRCTRRPWPDTDVRGTLAWWRADHAG